MVRLRFTIQLNERTDEFPPLDLLGIEMAVFDQVAFQTANGDVFGVKKRATFRNRFDVVQFQPFGGHIAAFLAFEPGFNQLFET